MSLKILKAGIHDTVQDMGRTGYQHLGINPGGAMDGYAAAIANLLVNNSRKEAVIEMYFPAAQILFEEPTVIAVTGADFSPVIDGEIIPLYQPIIIPRGKVLKFAAIKKGAWCYLAVHGGFHLKKWLGSFSANAKIKANETFGRLLTTGEVLKTNKQTIEFNNDNIIVLPWRADIDWKDTYDKRIAVIPGYQWHWLNYKSKKEFVSSSFTVSGKSDRMGYSLSGTEMISIKTEELVSSAVTKGAIQLLPDGKLVTLLADHQTTGGYPVIGHVISVHIPKLVQKKQSEKIAFSLTSITEAEELLLKKEKHLLQLTIASKLKFENYFI